jgi:hypothetical protein
MSMRAELDRDQVAIVDARWSASFPDVEPIGHWLRHERFGRWVRFHSLPGSKRHVESQDERREVVRRHRILLTELASAEVVPDLYVVTSSFTGAGVIDPPFDRLASVYPRARAWRTIADPDEPGLVRHIWLTRPSADEIDACLLAVAEGGLVDVVMFDDEMAWLYAPYCGGADVIAATAADRDAIRERHHGWLSSHPAGL